MISLRLYDYNEHVGDATGLNFNVIELQSKAGTVFNFSFLYTHFIYLLTPFT